MVYARRFNCASSIRQDRPIAATLHAAADGAMLCNDCSLYGTCNARTAPKDSMPWSLTAALERMWCLLLLPLCPDCLKHLMLTCLLQQEVLSGVCATRLTSRPTAIVSRRHPRRKRTMKMPDMCWIVALLVLLSVTQRAAALQAGKERSGGLVLGDSTTNTTFMCPSQMTGMLRCSI